MSGASAGGEPPPARLHPSVGAASGGPGRSTGASELPARLVFGLLVLACFAALIVTQRLKHTPTVLESLKMTPSFMPTGEGSHREEHISFKLTKADEVTVTIASEEDDDVATLVRDLPVPRYKQLSLRWNGRRGKARRYTVLTSPNGHKSLLPANHGALALPGEYSVRVTLRHQGRSIPSSRRFELVGP